MLKGGDCGKLYVDFVAVRDYDGTILRAEAYRLGIRGNDDQVYVYPEFTRRKEADRFLAILEKRGLATEAAFDPIPDAEIARIIAEEITLW